MIINQLTLQQCKRLEACINTMTTPQLDFWLRYLNNTTGEEDIEDQITAQEILHKIYKQNQ
jgi:hypothetical protein